jgi:nitroreductase
MPNETYQFIRGLRAVRDYQDHPLSPDDLDAVLEAARWTGSSKNRQGWSFVVVTDPDQIAAVASCGDFTDPVRRSAATIVLVQEPDGNEFDIGRAAQNIMLAAKAVGVASCPLTLHRHEDAARVMEAPEGARVRYAVALGYPAPATRPARFGGRRDLADLVHWDRYRS